MTVSTGMKCIKALLFIFNLIFFLVGMVLIIAGALVQTKLSSYFFFFGSQFNGAAIFLIVIGVIIFVVAFFGCLGAYTENHCMLMAFSVLLGIVFILEVAAAIAAFVFNRKLKDLVRQSMLDSIAKYDDSTEVEAVWNKTQSTLKCCGSSNYTDWQQSIRYAATSSVPSSCCKDPASPDCGTNPSAHPDTIYVEGCAETVIEWAVNNMGIIGGVAAGVAFIQIIGIILACCLASAIRKDYTPI